MSILQGSPIRPGVTGSHGQQMTLGDHINTIILMDYEKKTEPTAGKSFLSQINVSAQQGTFVLHFWVLKSINHVPTHLVFAKI